MRWPWHLRKLRVVIDYSSEHNIEDIQASRREAEEKLAQTEKETVEVRRVSQQSRRLRMQNEFGKRIAESYRRPRRG